MAVSQLCKTAAVTEFLSYALTGVPLSSNRFRCLKIIPIQCLLFIDSLFKVKKVRKEIQEMMVNGENQDQKDTKEKLDYRLGKHHRLL